MYLLEDTPRRALPTADGQEYSEMDIKANRFIVPSDKTYYNCILFKLPVNEKRHVVKVDFVVSPRKATDF